MRTLMAASAAAALVVSGAAFAASTDAAPAAQAPQQQGQVATPHKVAMHRRDRDAVGDRETAALNSLEASGYFSVKDIQPDGKNITVDAKKSGADFVHLTVLPDGTIQTGATPAT